MFSSVQTLLYQAIGLDYNVIFYRFNKTRVTAFDSKNAAKQSLKIFIGKHSQIKYRTTYHEIRNAKIH